MARPQKNGLDYFPLDVDIDQDDKVQLIEAQFGITGFGITIKLLMKIYKEGYFYEWTEKEQLLFSKRINVNINRVNDVINECIKWELFDPVLYENHKILTSKGIQRRYLEATARRKQVEIIKQYCLVDPLKYSNIVFVNINSINVDINSQPNEVNGNINPKSKVKKSKERVVVEGVPSPIPDKVPSHCQDPTLSFMNQVSSYYTTLTGRFTNSNDGVAITDISNLTADFELVKEAMDQANQNFKPKYDGDKIRSFSYFIPAIKTKIAMKETRQKAKDQPERKMTNGEHSKGNIDRRTLEIVRNSKKEWDIPEVNF